MTTRLFEIMRPVKFNDGRRVPRAHHRAWERAVLEAAGGFTVLAEAAGAWRDPATGKVYSEPMQPVRVACMPRVARRLAMLTKTHYSQAAVMFYSVSTSAEFV